MKYVSNPSLISRTHFARHLVDTGVCQDTSEVFRRFLTEGKPGFVPHRWASLKDAVQWIVQSQGVAVIAHPGRYKLNNKETEALLSEFRDLGGEAVEVVTGSHTREQYAAWARYAQRYGLKASAGSDFHGPGESYMDFGQLPDLPYGLVPIWESFE